eukprot:2015880-Rhodomonas_salina.1
MMSGTDAAYGTTPLGALLPTTVVLGSCQAYRGPSTKSAIGLRACYAMPWCYAATRCLRLTDNGHLRDLPRGQLGVLCRQQASASGIRVAPTPHYPLDRPFVCKATYLVTGFQSPCFSSVTMRGSHLKHARFDSEKRTR